MPTPPRMLTFNGLTLPLSEWAKRTGLTAETIRSRLDHQGWPVGRALTTPANKKFGRRKAAAVPAPRPCPKLSKHTGTGQAYCRWRERGKKHFRYFGPWGSKEAAEGYKRFAVVWAAGTATPVVGKGERADVADVIEGYLAHVRSYYVKGGKPTAEQHHQFAACRLLNDLFGATDADDFGPDELRACQAALIEKGYVRKTINAHVWRITRCFRWGVGRRLVHPDTHARLLAVDHLQRGRSAAAERPKVKPAPESDVEAIIAKPHADEGRRAVLEQMIRFHLLTGMRPGELCGMRAEDVDRSGRSWLYTVPAELNKNEHREKMQRYWLGPKARDILAPRLVDPGPDGRLWWFPPRGKRGTKRTPVSRGAYGEAVRMACDAAGVKRWHPHQLRHNRATEVQRRYEDDAAAAAAIGDTPQVATEVYIDPLDAVRRRIAEEMG